jgi:hypothetical protein
MRAVVVYESMFGNTHQVAEAIAAGCRVHGDAVVASVGEVDEAMIVAADLLVVGGPTHVHGMTRTASRKAAHEQAESDEHLELDPAADDPGLRDWLHVVPRGDGRGAAAFDTRVDANPMLTGRASKGIGKRLSQHGYRLVVEPESFLVDKQTELVEGELDRATRWGERLAASFATT